MAKYFWKIEPRDEDWSDDLYAYFSIHINLKKMVEYLTKEFKKDWWFKADYGQDNCYIVAENHDFPVRLFFTFDEGGWADITRHYTDGASYTDDHLGSWHFGKYDVDYSYAVIRDNIENYFYKFEESMKGNKKSLKEGKTVTLKKDGEFVDRTWSTIAQARDYAREVLNGADIYVNGDFWETVSGNKKSIKESFEYEDAIPLDEMMDILTEEWQGRSGGLFGESSHWDDEARDENRYIEISAILEFDMPNGSGYKFSNKKVEKEYDDECNEVYARVDDDNEEYFDIISQYDPILLLLTIDLKELLIYSDVDLGNGLGSTEVARERLADNEKDFRKQIQRMIDAF